MQRLEIWLEILLAVPCGQHRDFRHTQQCPTPLQAFLAIYSHLHINVLDPARRTPRPSRLAQTLPPATCSVPFVHCRPSARASRTCSTLSISHRRYETPAMHIIGLSGASIHVRVRVHVHPRATGPIARCALDALVPGSRLCGSSRAAQVTGVAAACGGVGVRAAADLSARALR